MMHAYPNARRATAVIMASVFAVTTVGLDFQRVAQAQGIGATGKQRVLLVPVQRAESVSSVVPGRIFDYVKTLLEMSRSVDVITMDGLIDIPDEPTRTAVVTDRTLTKADDSLWKGKEAASKGDFGGAIKHFKRAARLYEKRFDKLVDFDKYVDAALGVSLAYFLAGYEDNGEEALAPVLVLRPSLILDKRKVPKTAVAALARLTHLYGGGTQGEIIIESSPPGAEIFVDGNRVGQAPHTVSGLYRGRHVVRLLAPGHRPWSGTFLAGQRNQTVRGRMKPEVASARDKKKEIKVNPDGLVDALRRGKLGRTFDRVAKPIAERYALDAIALFYVRKTPTDFDVAPFLYDAKAGKVAELEWIQLDHGLTTMQVNLLVLEEKLNAALAAFPKSRVLRRKSKIYKRVDPPKAPPAPKPLVLLPKPDPKPKPVRVVQPRPKPKPKPRPRPKPKPRPKPRPTRVAQPEPVRPAPRYTPESNARRQPGYAPEARTPSSVRVPVRPALDDGLGGNLGRYGYPGQASGGPRAAQPYPTAAEQHMGLRDTADSSAWYEQWWVWVLTGVVVAGGATAAVVLTQGDDGPASHGGTVQW